MPLLKRGSRPASRRLPTRRSNPRRPRAYSRASPSVAGRPRTATAHRRPGDARGGRARPAGRVADVISGLHAASSASISAGLNPAIHAPAPLHVARSTLLPYDAGPREHTLLHRDSAIPGPCELVWPVPARLVDGCCVARAPRASALRTTNICTALYTPRACHSGLIRAITCRSHQHWPTAFSSLVADRPGRSNRA
jgi:hypothetical protein